MAKLVTSPIASIAGDTTSATAINSNFAAVVTAMEKTLSRDGTTPNQMTADLDLNTNDILNVGTISAETVILLNEGEIINEDTARAEAAADAAELSALAAAASAVLSEEYADASNQSADNAQLAEANAELAEVNAEAAASEALDHAIDAEAAKDAAELAASAATSAGNIYADTTAGLAASASGEYFYVVGTSGGLVVADLYLDNAGVAVDQDLALPSYAAYEAVVPDEHIEIITDAGLREPMLIGHDGRAVSIGSSGVRVDSEDYITTRNYSLKIIHTDEGSTPSIVGMADDGRAILLAQPPVDPITAAGTGDSLGFLFTAAQYEELETAAAAETLRLDQFDVTGYPDVADVDTSLRVSVGQSYIQGDNTARLFFSDAYLTQLGYQNRPCFSIGPDSRQHGTGPTYETYSGSTALTPLCEHYVAGTGVDQVHSDADAASGNYAANARGGTPETARDVSFWLLWNRWNLETDTDIPAWQTVTVNGALGASSIAILNAGDPLARVLDGISVFDGATVGTKQVDAITMNHGEADEAAGTTDYEAQVQDYDTNIWTEIQSVLGQSVRPPFIMNQPANARGAAAMLTSIDMVDMMRDGTGENANKHLVGIKCEVPTFHLVEAPHPDAGNDHPMLVGNVLMGLREGVGLHYIQTKKENYWVPFPFECKFEGNKFLLSIPNKFPPLREVDMVFGNIIAHQADLGITFEDVGGIEITVERARVVPGYKYLIEGYCDQDIGTHTIVKTGKGDLGATTSGFTNIRDSFTIENWFVVPFNKNQTITYGQYNEDPTDFGGYVSDIPGWVGKLDLGNPVARYQVTATTF